MTTSTATKTTTYTIPTAAELKEFTQDWGTWQQRQQASRYLTRYRLRDRWDEYTKRGSATVVGGAMATAQKALDEGFTHFFTHENGRDLFLHYYIHTHAHLITTEFLAGFHAHLLNKGVIARETDVQKWVGNKLADMVWTGYFREQAALANLATDSESTVRSSTNYEDTALALDIIKWLPLLGVEEGIQVKAPSFLQKVVKGDSGLLRKTIRCHQKWKEQADDRYTYIYIDVTGETIHPTSIAAIRYILKSMNIHTTPTIETVGRNTYLIITT